MHELSKSFDFSILIIISLPWPQKKIEYKSSWRDLLRILRNIRTMRTLFVLLAVVGLSIIYISIHIYTFISTSIMYIELDI